MRNKLGTLCMILGAALLVAALCLFVRNRMEDVQATREVEALLPQLQQEIQKQQENSGGSDPQPDPLPGAPEGELPRVTIGKYEYIGYVSIPALGVELPVMADWDDARLKKAPCRYVGSVHTDDMVVMAHNYTKHFGRLSRLKAGDTVQFTDMTGRVYSYRVAARDVLPAHAIEEMTAGEYPLTLFTCTYSGRDRITVFCDRVEE